MSMFKIQKKTCHFDTHPILIPLWVLLKRNPSLKITKLAILKTIRFDTRLSFAEKIESALTSQT